MSLGAAADRRRTSRKRLSKLILDSWLSRPASFEWVRSLRGVWRAHYTPKLKKRTALLRKLKDVFRRHQSQPVGRVVKLINPVLRGWVNYFRAMAKTP